MKSRTIARQKLIREIDEEIAVLQARRHALVMTCDISGAIMAPIRKLPIELLAEIIIKCIPPLPTKRRRSSSMSRSEAQVYPEDVGELLGKVCRAWRTIINDEPRIWSTVVLDKTIQAPEDINQLLKKSKSHPLDIFLEPCTWFSTADQENYDVVFKMLHSQLWRTRTFIADMRSFPRAVSGGIFPQGFSINAPMMQTFTHIRNSSPPVKHDLGTFHGPRLCSIILKHSRNLVRSLVANPVQTVRHLEVSFSRGSTVLYLQLLSALPNLSSLYWNGKDYVEQVQGATVVLNSLKALRLQTAKSAMDLLSFLHAPSLECLELLLGWGSVSMVPEIIGTLCGDGVVKLRHLHILEGLTFESGPDVGAMLGQLDCLETMIIEHSAMLGDLLTALSLQDRDFSSVCPQLTTLVVLHSKILPGSFLDFVHRRTRADWEEAVPGLVTSLKLDKTTLHKTNVKSCTRLAQTHSATIHFMSEDEYQDTSLAYIVQDEGDRFTEDSWPDFGWEYASD